MAPAQASRSSVSAAASAPPGYLHAPSAQPDGQVVSLSARQQLLQAGHKQLQQRVHDHTTSTEWLEKMSGGSWR